MKPVTAALLGLALTLASPAGAGAQAPSLRATWSNALHAGGGYTGEDDTFRFIVRTTGSGRAVRVRLGHRYGEGPLEIQAATVGIRDPAPGEPARGAAVVPETMRRLTFGGRAGVTLAPGESAYSDEVALEVRAGQDLAVSLHPADGSPVSVHGNGSFTANPWGQTNYATYGRGDRTAQASDEHYNGYYTDVYWLEAVEVRSAARGAVATLGDSLTDGYSFFAVGAQEDRTDALDRYPDVLARRLLGRYGADATPAVLNAGIGGNTLLDESEGTGPSGESRLERDVLSHAGVTHVVVLLGTNDLYMRDQTADAVIAGLSRVAARLRDRGVRVVGGTLPPRQGPYSTPTTDLDRRRVNAWIRTSALFDAVADFDRALADPLAPDRMRLEYDSGDGLHPNPAGYAAMAESVPLEALAPPAVASPAAAAPGSSGGGGGGAPPAPPGAPSPAPAVGDDARATSRVGLTARRLRGGAAVRVRGLVSGGPAGACRAGGRVTVTVGSGRRMVGRRRLRLRPGCRFGGTVALRRATAAPVRVTARFAGNARLRASRSRPVRLAPR